MPGRKILIRTNGEAGLAVQLRKLAEEIEQGHKYMNVSDSEGERMMRPLRDGEKTFYLDVKELP